ncbi:MAG TPA: hypothetical protein VFE37_06860 [Chloroflexota bacterium]|nr:hypothetical protein [Chloroflexota bacterium]
MPDPRPTPSRATLAALTTAAGLALPDAALDALVRPVAAVYAAVDSLDGLDLAEFEPAAVFSLAGEPPGASPGA